MDVSRPRQSLSLPKLAERLEKLERITRGDRDLRLDPAVLDRAKLLRLIFAEYEADTDGVLPGAITRSRLATGAVGLGELEDGLVLRLAVTGSPMAVAWGSDNIEFAGGAALGAVGTSPDIDHGLGDTPLAVVALPTHLYGDLDDRLRCSSRTSTKITFTGRATVAVGPGGLFPFDWVAIGPAGPIPSD